jgi:glycosyltransferase involved in cell wall biosynthesis
MSLISVIVPTHKRPQMLVETLASIRAQTFTDYEILVISNGENAEVRNASQTAAATYDCRYFALDEGNVSAARNFGIGQADGEWIAFLDDDDIWLPHKLQRQVAEATRTGADLIGCDYIEFYADGREILRQPRAREAWSYTQALNYLYWWSTPSGVIVRRSTLDAVGGFDRRQRYGEDNDLWRRISWRHHIGHVQEVLFRYRQGHASMMQRERLRYCYDLRYFAKMHLDTPSDLRSTLPPASIFVWNRLAIIVFPTWLRRKLVLEPGHAQWHRLFPSWFRPRTRSTQFRQWLRPRSRFYELRGWLRPRRRYHELRGWLRPKSRLQAMLRMVAGLF